MSSEFLSILIVRFLIVLYNSLQSCLSNFEAQLDRPSIIVYNASVRALTCTRTGQFYGVYGVQWWFTLEYSLCAAQCIYIICTYVYIRGEEEKEREKRREREREREREMPRRCYGVTPSLSVAAVIVPRKIIFRWEGNQFHDRIGEPSIRTVAAPGNATESGLNSNGYFFFEYHCLSRTLLSPRPGCLRLGVSTLWVI